MKEKRDAAELTKALRYEDDKGALKALIEIGEPAVDSLIYSLKDKCSGARMRASEALGRIGDKRAVDSLILF